VTLAPGFSVGHWTGTGTGVTVLLCPDGTIGSGEIRGGAPATRETALLEPERTVECVDAVVFSGGSAFGLAAADGVMAWLVEHDRGFPTTGGRVPIVPAAAIYDLVVAGDERVGAFEGRAAVERAAADDDDDESGLVGAGRGATVGKWRGPDHACAGGLGVATQRVGDASVGALAVVNAVGDVVDADGSPLACSSAPPGTAAFPDEPLTGTEGSAVGTGGDDRRASPSGGGDVVGGEATTLVAIVTDAQLTKSACHLLAQSGHVGIAHAVRPSHTRHDGDLVVALASGTAGEAHLDRLRVAAVDAVAEAVRAAVGHHGAR
jgi:L-aminopeptidase/D-esterase-like protein